MTITLGLFAELFLYGFIVPILPYMLQQRIGVNRTDTQSITSNLLGIFAGIQILMGPVIGILADKSSRRQSPLLFGLFIALAGTILMAVTLRVSMLYVARIAQGLSASIIWIVGSATLADTVGGNNMGKTLGTISVFTTAGSFSGPMIGGLLLETAGYWVAWSTAIGILVLDIVMRLAMVERPRKANASHNNTGYGNYTTCIAEQPSQLPIIPFPDLSSNGPRSRRSNSVGSTSSSSVITVTRAVSVTSEPVSPLMTESTSSTPTTEHSPLIPSSSDAQKQIGEISSFDFYMLLFRQRRILAATFCSLTFAMIVTSFDATIPLHVQEVFGWGSFPAGMMFVALQAPGAVFGPLCGWLRDHVGVRYPTTVGYLLIAPLLFALGLPGEVAADWASGTSGKALYITVLISIGVVNNLVNATGAVECALVVEALEKENPGIFGANGGYSRLYSIQGVAYTIGMLIGPELAGLLTNRAGYNIMTLVLAGQALAASMVAFAFLGPRPRKLTSIINRENRREEG
ncbi:MAG: hypothetical protein M1830_000751 [Pleopsidium flavum]|nr:MAG: hypothetical protein M1830_000751 [Pleopsidium flavum]